MAWAFHESKSHGRAAARGRGSTDVGGISDDGPQLQNRDKDLTEGVPWAEAS